MAHDLDLASPDERRRNLGCGADPVAFGSSSRRDHRLVSWTPRSRTLISTPPTSPAPQRAGSNYTNPVFEHLLAHLRVPRLGGGPTCTRSDRVRGDSSSVRSGRPPPTQRVTRRPAAGLRRCRLQGPQRDRTRFNTTKQRRGLAARLRRRGPTRHHRLAAAFCQTRPGRGHPLMSASICPVPVTPRVYGPGVRQTGRSDDRRVPGQDRARHP